MAPLADVRPDEVSIDRVAFAAHPRALQRRIVRLVLRDAFPESSRLEFDHIEAVCEGALVDSFARDLPGGLRAFAEYGRLIISRSGLPVSGITASVLSVPGSIDFEGIGRLSAEPGGALEPAYDTRTALLDADVLTGQLTVTSVAEGDRIRPFGMVGTRKVSDVLIDAKVPARMRPRVPVVRDGERIVWVVGIKSSEEYRTGPRTERTVRLTWEPRDPEGAV
jgi:tRNA(Ile)-lysidine synthase